MTTNIPAGWARSAIFQAAKACAAHAFDHHIANSPSQKFWQSHADNLYAIVDAMDATPPAATVPGEPETRLALLQAIASVSEGLGSPIRGGGAIFKGVAWEQFVEGVADLFERCAAPAAPQAAGGPAALIREVLTAVRAAHPNPEPGSIGAAAIAAINALDRLPGAAP